MSEHDVTKEQILDCLPNLDAIYELDTTPGRENRKPSWRIEFGHGDYIHEVGLRIELITNTGVHARIHEVVEINWPATMFMQQDTDRNKEVFERFFERLREATNAAEWRHRAILRARLLMK